MTILSIKTPRVFAPLLQPARYKGAHGGRGSGKSHFFAELLIEEAISSPMRFVCLREVQKSIKQSIKLLLEDKIKYLGVTDQFYEPLETEIRGKNGSLITFQGMQAHTAESIKSLEGYDRALLGEAQSFSQYSLDILRPTIRKEGSQIWAEWNPETDDVPIDKLLRGKDSPTDKIVVESNWRDNPFFPEVLRKEMEEDKVRDYDKYLHIWEGHYRRTLDGAVYAKEIRKAFEDKRVCRVLPTPGKPVDTFWDLGKRDHTAIWFAQMQLGEYRIPDFYQNRGEKLEHYAQVVKERGYPIGTIWLPHDAEQERLVGKTIKQAVRDLFPGITVKVIPRMAKKSIGIEAVRRIFPNCYFDEEKTKEGMKCLGRFKYDVDPDTGGYSQNPLHDENSDAADAFAQLALSLTEAKKPQTQTYHAPQSFWAQ
jgi:phage terminase large subunit